ncbi:MAG: lamin tail domain-containing protein [Methanomassiliicoccales archaeon]|nr:lamin tail domain-containing protein [Methanomassiliicoccales archaeon]
MAMSKKLLAIGGVLVLVVIIAAVALGGGNTNASNDGSNDQNDGSDDAVNDSATPGAGANVKIIEVESNPSGSDAGSEWLVIKNYGNSSVNVTSWKLYSTGGDAQAKILSGTIGPNETMRVTFIDQFLDNEDEVVKLYSADNVLVDQTTSITDNGNDSGTWVRP